MKIFINTDQIFLHGGIEKVMATKVNYWCALPDTYVYIITTEQKNNSPCYPLDKRVTLIDMQVNYNRSKSYLSLENLTKTYHHFKRQRKIFLSNQPDIIISPNFNFDHYWLPFIKGKAKLIKESHNSRYSHFKERQGTNFVKKIKYLFNDWIDSLYNSFVVLNPDEVKYVNNKNTVVIPNPVEATDYHADIEQKAVIAAGRINPIKGFDHLIKAWKKIHQEEPDWVLHIYGDSYDVTKKELESLIKEYKLESVISFKGSVQNIPETMQNYSIYALSSMTECFPTVLLEALSVGLPVVAYDCPNGPRHIITDQSDGLLADHRNIDNLVDKILNLMQNEDLRKRFSDNGKRNIKRFYPSAVMNRWKEIFCDFNKI